MPARKLKKSLPNPFLLRNGLRIRNPRRTTTLDGRQFRSILSSSRCSRAASSNLKSAVQRRKHLAETKCTEEACLRRGHSPKVNPKGAQACARRGGSMDFLMESGFMHWMSERMSFTNWVKADFHETSRITLKFSAPPRLRGRYRLGAGSSRYGNCFF